MIDFNKLTQDERERILSQHITTEISVDRETLNFENIEEDLSGTDLSHNFELPPVIVDEKHLAQILFYSMSDNKGRWIRTMVRTYMEGGKVLYKKVTNNKFVATLKF